MKQNTRGVGVGTISLVMIFAILCLTVFAMLTLSSSNAEKILADKTSGFVKNYYEADSRAMKIRALVFDSYMGGSLPESLDGVEITYERDGDFVFASYSCEVDDVQDLIVRLRLGQNNDTVLEWRTGYSQNWEFDDSLNVWDGDFFIAE